MTLTAMPFGMRPIFSQPGFGGSRGRAYFNAIPSGYGTNIYTDTPVRLNGSGQIEPVSGTNQDILGVFAGCEYVDSSGRWKESPTWTAGATFGIGATSPTCIVYVLEDPTEVYEIQLDGALAGGQAAALGREVNFNTTDIAAGTPAGSPFTGHSTARASATLVTGTNQGQLMIVDKDLRVDNDWSDPFPTVRVRIARHQLVANKGPVA